MLKIKYDINQQYLKTVDLHFVKSEKFSLTWSCESRQRVTISSGLKIRLNNLAVKGLKRWYILYKPWKPKLQLNTYIMGLTYLIVFRRQNLTSIDVRFSSKCWLSQLLVLHVSMCKICIYIYLIPIYHRGRMVYFTVIKSVKRVDVSLSLHFGNGTESYLNDACILSSNVLGCQICKLFTMWTHGNMFMYEQYMF